MGFEAKEIERQATRVEEELLFYCKRSDSVIKLLEEISNVVKTEDSALYEVILMYKEAFSNLKVKLKNKFETLATTMHNYAAKTLSNEEMTSQNVKKLKEALQDSTSLDSMNIERERAKMVAEYHGIDHNTPPSVSAVPINFD